MSTLSERLTAMREQVDVTSGAALVGMPFYATYVATKAGLARFGEALRRELKGESVDVLTVFPGGTDTPMMPTNHAGADLDFAREPTAAVGDATVEGIENGRFEVMRGGEKRTKLLALNREDPAAFDERFLSMEEHWRSTCVITVRSEGSP